MKKYFEGDYYFESGECTPIVEIYEFENNSYELLEIIALEETDEISFPTSLNPNDEGYCFVEITEEKCNRMMANKELIQQLKKYGYGEGNNCYYISIEDDRTIYFNTDDESNFTTVSISYDNMGGQEVVLYDNANIEALQELESTNYSLED